MRESRFKRLSGLVLLATACTAAACSSAQTHAEIPAPFQALYAELDQELSAADAALPAPDSTFKKCTASAPSLYLAASFFGPAERGSSRWNDILTVLDGFQSLGVDSVSIMISFPNLTGEVKDPEPLLKFYEALASEIRSRKMKLLIEHFIYPASAPSDEGKFVGSIKNLPDPKAAFLKWKAQEIKTVLTRIKPDYFTIITEPDTYAKFMGFSMSPDDFAQWLATLLPGLSRSKIKGSTRIGAGAGVWESDQYLQAFAKLRGLDYIDFHFYPMKLGSKDFVRTLLSWIDQVKKADPDKEIVISEAWLYKHGAQDPKGVFDVAAHGRNTYDFWTPLDARFLRLLDRIGRIKGVSVIAPYFSQYFFEMQAFDPKTPAKLWPACLTEEWQRAVAAIRRNRLSPIGAGFKKERESCKPAPQLPISN